MPKNTIKFVIFLKEYGTDAEYLDEITPYHTMTKDINKAKRFTRKGLVRVYTPLRNDSVRYHGYSKWGFERVWDKQSKGD
jgi:hypothetical protein